MHIFNLLSISEPHLGIRISIQNNGKIITLKHNKPVN